MSAALFRNRVIYFGKMERQKERGKKEKKIPDGPRSMNEKSE